MTSQASQDGPFPEAVLYQMLGGFQVSQALSTAAKLAIFDMLRDGPKTSPELVEAVGAHAPSLRRLLRFLTTIDILTEDEQGRFAATLMGELLRSDHPQSAHPWAVLLGAPIIWQPWGDLYETVLTGQPAFERAYGEPFFTYLGHSPQDAAVFNAAMTADTSSLSALLDGYDFSSVTRIIDVGGGQGALLRGVLERYPHTTGVLCDLPSVVMDAQVLKASAVAHRCEFIGGDMFASVPAGDAYLLKRIIHDWSDAEAIQVLRNCRQAISDDGRLLLIERVIQPSTRSPDLMMLILVTGRERTEEEFRDLFAAAGFRLTRVIPGEDLSIIEGIPV
ncbi:MAG: methyltransferase [Chloroflexota bacterium]